MSICECRTCALFSQQLINEMQKGDIGFIIFELLNI
jgi:hypothetical protein